jgi:N utilization substance protein B
MNQIDSIRKLAFDGLYLLHGGDRTDNGPDRQQLEEFTPDQRARAHQMALRRLAFQVLYELDQRGATDTTRTIADAVAGVEDLGPIAAEDVAAFVGGAFAARGAADAEFAKLAPEWPTHRLAAVDRAILRLAHFEMTSGRSHPKIVVNEAVELAKHFSTDRSPAFINGLLDQVMRRLAPEGTKDLA